MAGKSRWPRFGLSTRLILASVGLVFLTAISIELLADRNLVRAILPAEVDRLQTGAQRRADELGAFIQDARAEILSVAGTEPVKGMARAYANGGFDAEQNSTYEQWKTRLSRNMVSIMQARPDYYKFRVIGILNGGHEIVRVDRMGIGGKIRVVPDSELQWKGKRQFYLDSLKTPPGKVYTSPIELNQDNDKIEVPHVPVLRVSTLMTLPDGKPFAVLIANIDVTRMLQLLRDRTINGAVPYLIDQRGGYVVHPDRSKEFGLDLGVKTDWREDFPGLAAVANGGAKGVRSQMRNAPETYAVAASVLPSEPFYAAVIQTRSRALMVKPLDSIRSAARATAAGALLLAILIAVFVARSMTKPLERLTETVVRFDGETEIAADVKASGEVGALAKAFSEMSKAVIERTATLRKLYEMERLYGAVVESSADAIVTSDLNGMITSWNAAAERIFGHNSDEIIGQPAAILLPEDRLSEFSQIIQQTLESKIVHDFETVFAAKSGRTIQVSVSLAPVHDESGKVRWITITARDITDQRLLDERLRLAQKMEAIGTLAGGIAHDFNNILTAIAGNAKLAQEELPPGHPVQRDIAEIEKASARGASVVRQILRISRAEEAKNEPISIPSVVEETIQFLRATKPDNIEIRTEYEPDMPAILGDQTEIHQVVMNLGVNALHAMREKGGLLEVVASTVYLDEVAVGRLPNLLPGRYIRLSVSDTGKGMDTQTLSRIFEPFFTTKGVNEGTGLGLAVVYGIVERHKGAITAYSELGKGTLFRIYLPAVESAVPEKQRGEMPDYTGKGESVMYVDDDEALVLMVTRMLRRLNYEVAGFVDPQEALKEFITDPGRFDIVITDLSMPRVDGPEFVRQLLTVRPSTPIVMVTGYIRPEDIERTKDTGIRALVLKPNTVQDMGKVLHELLSGIKSEQSSPAQ